MLICPNCQFENADANKFCQDCGTSLTQKSCPDCGTLVSFSSQKCPTCGASTGSVWLAVIRCAPGSSLAGAAITTATGQFLDTQQRYQLLDPLPENTDTLIETQVRVLDCHPFQKSLLQTAVDSIASLETTPPDVSEQTPVTTSAEPLRPASASDTTLLEALPTPDAANLAANADEIKAIAIPPIAQPYLELGAYFHQALPEIHDAWQHNDYSVVLLEDYSHLPTLPELLQNSLPIPASDVGLKVSEPSAFWLQILHWLYEIADLWAALEPWQCCESLLTLSNLRVDEDQVLHVQRLYADPEDSPRKLDHLGQVWQLLVGQSQQTQWGDLALLLNDLQAGKILTTDELLARIEAAAHELQAHSTSTVAMPETHSSESTDSPTGNLSQPLNPGENLVEVVPPVSTDLNFSPPPTVPETLPPEPIFAFSMEDGESDSDDTPTVVLPMQLSNLEHVGRTDIGRQRDHNEDYYGIESQVSKLESPSGRTVHARGVYILCDGMGGHAGGEVASALAVDTLRQYFQTHWWDAADESNPKDQKLPPAEIIRQAIQLANKTIYDVNQQNARSGSGRMGTTLVMVLLQDTEVAVAHVGDSRLYRYTRKRGLEQVTTDHEVGQREIQRGVDPDIAYGRPDAYQLTQALGPRDENFVSPDVQFLELNEDTLLLLCSDGLTDNNLLENHWKTHVEPLLSSQTNLEQGVSRLIDLANQYNGHDNITALVIQAKVRPNLEQLRS